MLERPCDTNLVSAMSVLALEIKSVFFLNERIYFNFELESQQLYHSDVKKKKINLINNSIFSLILYKWLKSSKNARKMRSLCW